MLKPELRQNFTVDMSVLDDVAAALDVQPGDKIVEVGTGKGMLTQRILNQIYKIPEDKDPAFLLGYEVDNDLFFDLESFKKKNPEFFDFRIQSFLDANRKLGFNKCTGNIPYHISEPLFFKQLEWDFDLIVFITGIKYAKRVTGEMPGNLAIISKYLYNSEIVKIYDKNIFYPKSKVDSALLVMRKKIEFENSTEEKLNTIMKNVFKKHTWLNKYLGYDQGQTGQIYHMDLERLVESVNNSIRS